MLYTYRPKHDTRIPRLGIAGAGVYEVDEADAAELNARITGADGPALVPFVDAAAAAADFISAISAPTPHNPETPDNPADVTPLKRGRKARSEA